MSNEDALKKQVEDLQRDRVKAARRCTIMLGGISIVALLAFAYAYIKTVDADRNFQMAKINEELASKQARDVQAAMKTV